VIAAWTARCRRGVTVLMPSGGGRGAADRPVELVPLDI